MPILPLDPYQTNFFFHTNDPDKLSDLCKTIDKTSSFNTYMIHADRPDKYFAAHHIALSRTCKTKPTLTKNNTLGTYAYRYNTNNQWHTYAQIYCDTRTKLDDIPILTHMRNFGYENLEVKTAHVAFRQEFFRTDRDTYLEMTRTVFRETGNAYAGFQLRRHGSHTPKDQKADFAHMKEFLDEAVSMGLLRPMEHRLAEFPEFEIMKLKQG